MQTQQSKELPSSLFPKSIVKSEETFPICAVKQENGSAEETCHLASPTFVVKRPLIDSRQEMTTPYLKRMKQERDDPPLCEHEERNFRSSKTSLQNIVREVAHSFEERILSLQENDNLFFDSAKRPLAAQADKIVFDDQERQPNSCSRNTADEYEDNNRHENIEAFATSVDNHKGDVSVPSVMNQVQEETTQPVLRTIKGIDSGKSEGFAYDHNFFPKLVGVHSISTPTSSSPVVESHYDFQQTGSSPPVRGNLCQNRTIDSSNMEEDPDVFEVDANASLTTNQIIRNSLVQSPTNFQSEKQYDLLLSFTQDDGKSDMFLVIKDKVYAVRRFEYRGESYLIHTDHKGKTSILAKAPKEEQTGSQDYVGRNAATGRDAHQMRVDTTNAPSIASEQSTQQSYQRNTSQHPTPPLINSTTVQNSFVQTFGVSATEAASAVPSGQRQTAYGDTRLPRRQLSNQTNSLRTESPSHRQRSPVPAGHQGFPLQTRTDRHKVVANGSLQNSTAIPMNVHSQVPRDTNTLSNIVNNQQFIVNQGSMDVNNLRSNYTNAVLSPQQHTESTAQIPHKGYNTALSGRQGHVSEETIDVRRSIASALATGDNRIEQRRKLMNYIAHQLASSKKPNTSTRNSSELINLVSNRREEGRQINNENAGITQSISNGQGMAGPLQQLQNLNASLAPRISELHSTTSRSISSVVNNLGIRDGEQRCHPNQRVVQNGGVVHSQPRSDAIQHNANPLQGGVPSNEETEGDNKILQIIESWKRHQQTISSSRSQFQQLRDLLTRVDGSINSAQNTNSSPVERTVTNHSQLAQPSTVASTTPVISQISYGVISRSTDGENVIPKRTATALVIDQRHSIYIDATDSVIDEESRSKNAGKHFSNIGNTVSGPHSNQSGNVAVSFPVPSGQQLGFSRGMRQHSAPVSLGNSSVVAGLLDQQFQSYKLQSPKTAPKTDKRCVANNTLNPINIPTGPIQVNPPRPILFVPTFVSGQQTCISEVQVQGNSNIGNPCQGAYPRSGEVARPREAAKPCEVSKPCKVVTPCHLDKTGREDVIEIVDSPPTQYSLPDSTLDIENNEREKIVDDQRSCINDGLSNSTVQAAEPYCADKNKTEHVVEIKNLSLKRNSVDHKTDEKDSAILQPEEDEQTRNNALRAELVKKIQNTNERIAQEKIEWKKSRLNRLKIVLTKKLAKIPGVIDVTVIEDD